MSLKLFGKNAVIYAIGQTGLRLSGFVLLPIYTHFLSLNDYGLLATLLLTVNFMVTVIDFGLRSGLMRYAPEYFNENKIKYLFGSMIVINIIIGVIVTIAALIFKPVLAGILHTDKAEQYIQISCLSAVVQSLSLNIISFYRAKNQGMRFMILNLSAAVILILANIGLFVIFNNGIPGAQLAYVISYGLVGLVAAIGIFRKIGFGVSKESFVKLFKYSGPLIFATSGLSIMETTAAYYLGFFTNLEQVGIYNLGYRLAGIAAMVILLPFQLAYEPFLFANLNKPDIKEIISRITTYLVFAFALVSFLVVFVCRDLMAFISPPEYGSAYLVIFLLLPGIAFHGLHYIGQSLLHIKNKTHITGSAIVVFSVLSLSFNYFFIQKWGMAGLLVVYNSIWFLIALMLMILGIKTFPIKLETKRLLIITFSSVLLLTIVYLLHSASSLIFYTIVPAAFISMLVWYYYSVCDDKERKFLKQILSKLKSGNWNKMSAARVESGN